MIFDIESDIYMYVDVQKTLLLGHHTWTIQNLRNLSSTSQI